MVHEGFSVRPFNTSGRRGGCEGRRDGAEASSSKMGRVVGAFKVLFEY